MLQVEWKWTCQNLTEIISSFLHCWDRSRMPLTNSLLALMYAFPASIIPLHSFTSWRGKKSHPDGSIKRQMNNSWSPNKVVFLMIQFLLLWAWNTLQVNVIIRGNPTTRRGRIQIYLSPNEADFAQIYSKISFRSFRPCTATSWVWKGQKVKTYTRRNSRPGVLSTEEAKEVFYRHLIVQQTWFNWGTRL